MKDFLHLCRLLQSWKWDGQIPTIDADLKMAKVLGLPEQDTTIRNLLEVNGWEPEHIKPGVYHVKLVEQ